MATKLKKSKVKDRHLPTRMVRVKESFAAIIDVIADHRKTSVTAEINRIVRERLESDKLWPPSQ